MNNHGGLAVRTGPETSSTQPEGADLGRLRFGTHLGSNSTTIGFQTYLTTEIGRRLGVATEFVVETSYGSCLTDMNEVCFVCSLPYVTFQREGLDLAIPLAAPVLMGERYHGHPIYFSDVIVHRDSGIRSFLDLRGRSWAYNEPLSQSGYGITRYHLVQLGETGGFFSRVVEAGFHSEAIRMVAHREIDGAAIDSQVLAIELREHPDLAEELRVVDQLGPSTIQPIAVSRRVGENQREAIRRILLTLPDNDEGREHFARVGVDHFTSVDASDYDDIRMMVDRCEEADFLELR